MDFALRTRTGEPCRYPHQTEDVESMIEREMEDIISCYPEETLGEPGLQLLARQYSIGSYRFDLLFKDRQRKDTWS